MTRTTPPSVGIGPGLVCVAAALAALMHGYPEQLRAPAWIADIAVGLCQLAGACIVSQARGWVRLVR